MYIFKEKGGLKPQLATETRWNLQLDCLNSYIINWIHYYDIVREHREHIERDIIKIIEDRSIYSSSSDLNGQLKIVGALVPWISFKAMKQLFQKLKYLDRY